MNLLQCYNQHFIFSGLLTFINCANVKWAARVQVVFTVTKVVALVLIIIVGGIQLGYGEFLDLDC